MLHWRNVSSFRTYQVMKRLKITLPAKSKSPPYGWYDVASGIVKYFLRSTHAISYPIRYATLYILTTTSQKFRIWASLFRLPICLPLFLSPCQRKGEYFKHVINLQNFWKHWQNAWHRSSRCEVRCDGVYKIPYVCVRMAAVVEKFSFNAVETNHLLGPKA